MMWIPTTYVLHVRIQTEAHGSMFSTHPDMSFRKANGTFIYYSHSDINTSTYTNFALVYLLHI